MPDDYVGQSAARRITLAILLFYSLLAVAAVMMLLGQLVGLFVIMFVGLMTGFVTFGLTRQKSRQLHELMRESSFRWLVVLVRATGWNPKLVGLMLATPLVVFAGTLIWMAIIGGPDFGDEF